MILPQKTMRDFMRDEIKNVGSLSTKGNTEREKLVEVRQAKDGGGESMADANQRINKQHDR